MAQRITIILRVTLCYLAGVIESLLTFALFASFATPQRYAALTDHLAGFALVLAAGLLVSWPLWLTAVVVAFVFARSVAARPGLWTAAATLIVAGFSYGALPFDGEIRSVATVGTLAAALAGISFYCWSVSSPVRPVSN
ncbi:hypothetical protein OHD62_20605 [Mesorhizobium sp. YC-39]|uniref:hypothetical protein n=1 Tax=unclassified Mesorhizobium TaxID=325217 RepID=UPI0021E6E460|nr:MULTISPECIES: hypothetical protein [unclassified Mesorhizobium]MCV3210246.1 hypothetical protein [Mesorhizobium sp. YC-2]MCV3230776.1 hypothetical protein [Mesorhizobium sp. YC-39]